MEDVVVIGGLVPSLLIDQRDLPDGVSTHVGTMKVGPNDEIQADVVGFVQALLDRCR